MNPVCTFTLLLLLTLSVSTTTAQDTSTGENGSNHVLNGQPSASFHDLVMTCRDNKGRWSEPGLFEKSLHTVIHPHSITKQTVTTEKGALVFTLTEIPSAKAPMEAQKHCAENLPDFTIHKTYRAQSAAGEMCYEIVVQNNQKIKTLYFDAQGVHLKTFE